MKRIVTMVLIAALAMLGAKSCAPVHTAVATGNGTLVWTGVHPPARTGGAWVRQPGSSTWRWIAGGAVAGLLLGGAAATLKDEASKRVVTMKVRYGATPKVGDPCNDQRSSHNLVWWRVEGQTMPDYRLDCEGFRFLMLGDRNPPAQLKNMYDCIFMIIAGGSYTRIGPRSGVFNWKGGEVVVDGEDRIVTAHPPKGTTWDTCPNIKPA